MGKFKTKKAAAKRFKVTANGKIKFKRAGKRHQLGHRKSASNKLALRKGSYVHAANINHIIRSLPYA